jgi:oligopeptide transport system substrate-binding protein
MHTTRRAAWMTGADYANRRGRTARCAALLSGALLLLAGCGSGERAPSADKRASTAATSSTQPITLRRGNGPEPDTIDPQRARTDGAFNILRDLFEGLTAVGPTGAAIPAAAESWTVSADGREYTFHLREGLRWSNGDALTAADFVAGLRRLVDPKTASPYAQFIDPVVNASAIARGQRPVSELGVAAPDPRTVVIRLVNPAPYLPGLMAQPPTFPVHQPSLAQNGADYAKPGKLLSNGAFVLDDWVIGSKVVIRRNATYRANAGTRIDRVEFVHVADPGAEFRQYRAGEIDVTYVVPPPQFSWIKQNMAAELHVSPQLSVYYYGFNLTQPPFKGQPDLRRALSMVIDREKLTTAVTGVGETPAYSWIPPGVSNYSPQRFDYADKPMAERITEARQLYANAGYSPAQPLKIQLRYNSGEVHNRLAVAIAAMWKESLGVQTELYAEEFRALLSSIQARKETQVFRASWVGDFNDAYTFAQLLQSDFGINLTGYSNAQYDTLLAQAVAQGDPAQRRALLESAERLMLAEHPLLPIYFYVNKHLVKPQVQGWTDNVMNVVYSKDLALGKATP